MNRNLLLISLIIFTMLLVVSFNVFAQDQYQNNKFSFNQSDIWQAEKTGFNSALIVQNGNQNQASIKQFVGNNKALVKQYGFNNKANVVQVSSYNNLKISQFGNNDSLKIKQN